MPILITQRFYISPATSKQCGLPNLGEYPCCSMFVPVFNNPREIMCDNRFVDMSGINDQWIAADMNIERMNNFRR